MRWSEEGAWPLSRKDGSFSRVVAASRKRRREERKNRCESSGKSLQTGRKLARRLRPHQVCLFLFQETRRD